MHLLSFGIKVVKQGLFFHLVQYSIEISPHVGASINFHYFWQRRFIMNNC